MAVQVDQSHDVATRLRFLDERVSYADFETQRNLRWERLHQEMAEEKHGRALEWSEEKARCERERDQLFGSLVPWRRRSPLLRPH